METFISILRGINVTGQRLVKMDALKQIYTDLGFHEVRTYVQSGNVIFMAEETGSGKLEQRISERIQQEFGYRVPVIVLNGKKLGRIIEKNPFTGDRGKDPKFMHVTFLVSPPVSPDYGSIESKKSGGEEIRFTDEAVYLYCPNGYGKSKLSNNLLESRLGVTATTRNWKTTNQLMALANR